MATQTLVDLIVLGALWGASFLFMRVAAPAFGPVPLIFVRVTIAALVLLPAMLRQHGLAPARAVAAPLALVGAINTAIPFTLLAFAALTLPAGLSSVLNASVPLFGGLIGFLWLGQRPSRPARARARPSGLPAWSCWRGPASRARTTGARWSRRWRRRCSTRCPPT